MARRSKRRTGSAHSGQTEIQRRIERATNVSSSYTAAARTNALKTVMRRKSRGGQGG